MLAKVNDRSWVRLMILCLLLLLLTFLAPPEGAQQEPGMAISVESDYISIYQSTGVLVQMYTRAGEGIARQEVTFTANLGTVTPNRAVTDVHGEVWVTFIASDRIGASQITASARGLSEMILITVGISTPRIILQLAMEQGMRMPVPSISDQAFKEKL